MNLSFWTWNLFKVFQIICITYSNVESYKPFQLICVRILLIFRWAINIFFLHYFDSIFSSMRAYIWEYNNKCMKWNIFGNFFSHFFFRSIKILRIHSNSSIEQDKGYWIESWAKLGLQTKSRLFQFPMIEFIHFFFLHQLLLFVYIDEQARIVIFFSHFHKPRFRAYKHPISFNISHFPFLSFRFDLLVLFCVLFFLFSFCSHISSKTRDSHIHWYSNENVRNKMRNEKIV